MLLDNYKKQSPIVGVAGLGGGINSYIFLSSGGGGDFVISKSLRFNSADTPKLTRTPSSASNRKTWTLSFWIKRTTTGSREQIISAAGSKNTYVEFQSDKLMIEDYEPGVNLRLWTTRVFRDPSAWYHIVVAMDTTQATSSNRVKIYVNGVQETVYDTATYPSQNYDTSFNNTGEHKIGQFPGNTNFPLNAYLADFHLVDGQQLAATDFGSTDSDGVWQPKKYSGAHGTNGFHLDFKDTSSIGNDAAGSNNWTASNITTAVYGLATANQGMDVVTYDGNGSSRNIGGLAFAPDLVIIKSKSNNGYNHYWVDRVRGTNQNLYSNTTESTHTADRLSSFNSDGFGLTSHDGVNSSGKSYVAWAWKAGGSASSNSNGTITSSVSASTTYGFSVVTWTGAGTGSAKTVGHSLGAVPKFIITKSRSLTDNWGCYHASLGSTKDIFLNTTGIPRSYPTWNNTNPTSSVFSVGQTGQVNESGETYVAYCWSEISGYSKFSSYTGNGNATGTIVTTGFKPRFLVVKRTDVVDNWAVFDSARNLNNDLKWNTSEAEGSAPVEFLSDGFQLKNTYGSTNANGGTYIYAAFASKPDPGALDVLLDSPSQSVADETDTGLGGQITGNYATLNPLSKSSQTNIVLANGNLEASNSSSSGQGRVHGTIAMSSGKWYFEATVTGSSSAHEIGIIKTTEALNYGIGLFAGGYSYMQPGTKFNNNSTPSYGASYTTGDTIGVAFDADNGTLIFYKNGASQGTAFTGLSGTFYPAVSTYSSAANFGWKVNFGQRAFSHAAPSGYKALTVENLSDPTGPAAEPNKYFDTKLWTGTGSARSITMDNSSMSPDFVWIKARTDANDHHHLFDTIRGAGKRVLSNGNGAESTDNNTLSAFDSNGFSLGTQSAVNGNGDEVVSWNWESAASTVTNTAGSIDSQVRADQAAGFSIVTYTAVGGNNSFGHGLNVKPKFILIKNRSNTADWFAMFDTGAASYQHGYLNSNSGFSAASAQPVSTSTITYGNDNAMFGANGNNYLAYCFAPVANYSAMDTYTGNGSSDGIFVHTGFKPAFLLTKRTNASENWEIRDNKRNPYNRVNRALFPHTSGAEDTGSVDVDFLSNGFKIRTANGSINASGGIYMYYAVAEGPFKTARAR